MAKEKKKSIKKQIIIKNKEIIKVKSPENVSDRRAICVKQPMAWLIVNGIKDVENRNNPPFEDRIGKKVFIHASQKRVTKQEYIDFLIKMKKLKVRKYPKSINDFVYSAIVGSVFVDGFTRNSRSMWAQKDMCHWLLRNANELRKPKKMDGKQTLFWKF